MGYGAFYVICPKASSQSVTPLSGPMALTYGTGKEEVIAWFWLQLRVK